MEEHPGTVTVLSSARGSSAAWVDGVRPQSPVRPRVAEQPRIQPDRALVVLEERRGCGNGRWCRKCREEIREEALRWIRELNAPPEWRQSSGAVPYRPWHAELLLGDC